MRSQIEEIKSQLSESGDLKLKMAETLTGIIEQAVQLVIDGLKTGKKVIICGNGGSASDAQHMAAELVGRFARERRGLPAIALTTDSSILTSVSNDYGFQKVFARQVEALGCEGDILIGISTSGTSKNVIEAFHIAKKKGLKTIFFIGAKPGPLSNNADLVISVPSENTARIQEGHITVIHIICDLVESSFYKLAELEPKGVL